MKFFAAATAFLATSVAAMPTLIQRDVTSINKSINALSDQVIILNNSVAAFQPVGLPTLPQLLDIITKTNNVGDAVLDAQKAANESAPLDFADSLTVGLRIISFQPVLYSLLSELTARKKDFDSVEVLFSVRKTVLGALQLEQTLAAQLGTAIKNKIDSSLDSLADSINSDIADHFASAIQVYSVPAKNIELPGIPSGVANGKVYRRNEQLAL